VIGSVGLGAVAAYFGWKHWKNQQQGLVEPENKKSLL
jgi:hypothetical protein